MSREETLGRDSVLALAARRRCAVHCDPIFNGLVAALIFGIMVSTVLTLIVIPLLYYALLLRRARAAEVA